MADDPNGSAGAPAAATEFAVLIKDYIEREAFAFWVRLVAESADDAPEQLVSVLSQRCPGFAVPTRPRRVSRARFATRFFQELLAWIEERVFPEVRTGCSLDDIRASARTHLRGERIAAYWANCASRWAKAPPKSFPNFEEWLKDADEFVTR